MSDLAATFSSLVRRHIATPAAPLPAPQPGITWVWAANGIWKRGVTRDLDILIRVGDAMAVPGLAALLPHVRYRAWPKRLPGQLLAPLLADARRAGGGDGAILRPIEKQYFLIWRDQDVRLIAPTGQDASSARVSYAMPARGVVLCDIHSHHEMAAYFSATDDRDDTASGVSVSAVVGRIFTRPEIRVRLNVYGARLEVPAALVFDNLGPFVDAGGTGRLQNGQIHVAGTVLYQEETGIDDESLLVVADGRGSASALLIYTKHGQYPLHHSENRRWSFPTEQAALDAVPTLLQEGDDADLID